MPTEKPVRFFSAGVELAADLYTSDAGNGAAVLLCCGYTGIKDLYLNEMARRLARAGFVALTFDYRGWGKSAGEPRLRLSPYGRVEDTLNALTFLAGQAGVDAARLGLYGISYGGSTAAYAAAIDSRVKAVVSVTGVGDGARWMRGVRTPWEYRAIVDRGLADWQQQVVSGASQMADRSEVLQHDPQSAEIAAAARRNLPGAAMQVPLEMVHETLQFSPEWVVGRIAPRAALFVTSDADELVLPEESVRMHAAACEPKKLVVLKGYGHYQVFTDPALSEVMAETTAWFDRYL